MFTGLVEETGTVIELNESSTGHFDLRVRATKIGAELHVGDSVAVNGACLTVAEMVAETARFDLLAETLGRTNLAALRHGSIVNLERALPANGRFGGHIVQGHIDCSSRVLAFEKIAADYRLEIELPREFAHYIAPKGSIAVSGVSLTVAAVLDESFSVWIIPHTFAATNFRTIHRGASVNLEFDILAKYVERLAAKKSV
jgi:riboflavin synthase